jgi:hypothetical protein
MVQSFATKVHGPTGDTLVTGSVDGRDFQIFEPEPFDSKWFSQKFKGPGLGYEIDLSLEGCDIVHAMQRTFSMWSQSGSRDISKKI